MYYQSPLKIIPKFLWKPIVDNLPYAGLIKLTIVSRKFIDILDNNAGKDYFLNGRNGKIVIVKCCSERINFFWKYAIDNHTIRYDINSMLTHIMVDNDFIMVDNDFNSCYHTYKIFIKSGTYTVRWDGNKWITQNDCKIEIIKSDATIFNFPRVSPPTIFNDILILTSYLSITNIIFNNNMFQFKHGNCNTELHFSNCTFRVDSGLNIIPVNIITITNCVFNKTNAKIYPSDSMLVADCIFNDAILILPDVDFPRKIMGLPKIKYTIVRNIFCCPSVLRCIYLEGNYDKTSSIIIANNNISNSDTLCCVNTFWNMRFHFRIAKIEMHTQNASKSSICSFAAYETLEQAFLLYSIIIPLLIQNHA